MSQALVDHNYLKYYTIKPNDIIVDAGASTGLFVQQYYNTIINNDAIVYCIEPSPWNINHLATYINEHPQLRASIITSALASSPRTEVLHISDAFVLNRLSSTGHKPEEQWGIREVKQLPVTCITTDILIEMVGGKIDFLKMDIEGAEIEAIMSCNNLDKIHNMCIAAYHLIDGEETWVKLKPFLESKGFDVTYDIEPYLDFNPQSLLFAKKKEE